MVVQHLARIFFDQASLSAALAAVYRIGGSRTSMRLTAGRPDSLPPFLSNVRADPPLCGGHTIASHTWRCRPA